MEYSTAEFETPYMRFYPPSMRLAHTLSKPIALPELSEGGFLMCFFKGISGESLHITPKSLSLQSVYVPTAPVCGRRPLLNKINKHTI